LLAELEIRGEGTMMRSGRIRATVVLFCLALLSHVQPGFAGEPRGHAITLVSEEMKPFTYMQDGAVRGFAAEIIAAALDGAGLEYSIEILPWTRAYDRALKDKGVFIFSMARTAEREHKFVWVHPLAPARICLFRLAAREDLASVGRQGLPGWRVAAIRGYFTVEILTQWGVPASKITLFADHRKEALLEHMELGRSDFFLGDPLIFATDVEEAAKKGLFIPHGEYIRVSDYYLAANPGTDPEVIARVRAAMSRLFDTGEADAIRDRYLKNISP